MTVEHDAFGHNEMHDLAADLLAEAHVCNVWFAGW